MRQTGQTGTLGAVGDGAEAAEFEDVLDRLEVWHRGNARDAERDDDHADVPARR